MTQHESTAISFVRRPAARYHQLWLHARLLAGLTEHLRKCLPDQVASHCVAANVRHGELVIGTDSPVWAARLRYYSPQILKHLATQSMAVVHRIKIRAMPPAAPETSQPPSRMRISRTSGEVLKQTARAIADPRLRKALLKLAARTK